MRVFTERKEKFRVCGVKAALAEKDKAAVRSLFMGKDGGARFECLIGCREGYLGVKKKDGTYLFGKEVFPTVYMPDGGSQWAVPGCTFLKAVFTQKEARTLTLEGAWRFFKEIYIPSSIYETDPEIPFEIESFPQNEQEGGFELLVPVLSDRTSDVF